MRPNRHWQVKRWDKPTEVQKPCTERWYCEPPSSCPPDKPIKRSTIPPPLSGPSPKCERCGRRRLRALHAKW